MFFFKRKEEVYVTGKPEAYSMILHILKEGQIPFQTKTANSGSTLRRVGRFSPVGRAGENLSLELIYYVYTDPKDAEKARYLIREWQRTNQMP